MWTRLRWRHMPNNFCRAAKLQCVAFCRTAQCGRTFTLLQGYDSRRAKRFTNACAKKRFFRKMNEIWELRNKFMNPRRLNREQRTSENKFSEILRKIPPKNKLDGVVLLNVPVILYFYIISYLRRAKYAICTT